MKRIIISISLLFFLCINATAQQLDSAVRVSLDARLTEYFDALMGADTDLQKAEADFMIEASSDSLVRQFVARKIYDYYVDSPVMGAEAVAIHIYDRWFSTGEVSMGNDLDFFNARIFAEFNRQSLVGKKAPELVMETMSGDTVRLFSDKGRRYSVLFFYDAGCAKCKLESILLRNLMETEGFPIDVYAIYAGDNRQAWESYVSDRFADVYPKPVHLWDPTLDSDFLRKYGVVQTPRLFLVRPDGVIAGRGLDVRALSSMLHAIFDQRVLEYGKPESDAYFDRVFSSISDPRHGISYRDVVDFTDQMAESTLEAGDTTLFRQFTGDLLYYLSPKSGEWAREGLGYIADRYVLSRGDIWKSQDDSLKVVGFAQIMADLLSKGKPGSLLPDIKVPGELIRNGRKIKSGEFNLRKLRSDADIIIFYTDGCHVCEAEKAAARALVASDSRYKALLVNVDRIVATDPSLANRLFNAFDLSTLPYLVESDRRGKVIRRYFTLQQL